MFRECVIESKPDGEMKFVEYSVKLCLVGEYD